MIIFWIGVAVYILGAAADAYTTKRALFDRKLPLKEGNRMAAWLFDKIGFWPAVLLTKGGWLALVIAIAPTDPNFATFAIWVFAAIQLLLGYRNRKKIIKARGRLPVVLLLLSAPAVQASWLPTQEWSWDEVTQNVNGNPITVPTYRIYESPFPDCFQVGDYTEVSATLACDDVACDPARCCADPPEPSETRYFHWVAVSSAGVESVWPTERRKELTCP